MPGVVGETLTSGQTRTRSRDIHGGLPTVVDVPSRRSPRLLLAAVAAVSGLVLAGCAEFDDTAADGEWRAAPKLTPQKGPQPELPEAPGGEELPGPGGGGPGGPGGLGGPAEDIPPPEGCTDHDPAVIGTCLDTVVAVAALPLGGSEPAALAAEQRSGRVFKVVRGTKKPTNFARIAVSASGGGGLTGLALSPSYTEDNLVFAYVTTGSDNRVVRFAKGRKPKPVLTGIPKGSSGNRGVLATDASGALLVATGNAGNSRAAADPKSLAGKVLRIDTSGKPAAGNPKAGSPVIASGLHSPGGICAAPDGTRIWVTDRGPDADTIHRVERGKPLGTPVWSWKDKPGVAGCADAADGVSVAMSRTGGLHGLEVDNQGSVTGKPQITGEGKTGYGRLGGMDLLTEDVAIAGTVNKDGGKPVSSDDRVVILRLPVGAGNNKD
jgi:glucose/arabinose dehydrogenase